MAVAIATTSTLSMLTALSGGNIILTKPTGLAVGDLLLACVSARDTGISISTPSGWTNITNASQLLGSGVWASFYKVADASDVSASNFSFTPTSGSHGGGHLFRITGAPSSTPSVIGGKGTGAGNQATASISLSATPLVADSLIILLAVSDDASDNAGTFSNYTLTGGTSPAFSEQFDEEYAAGDTGWALASAVYASSTAISAIGFDQTGGANATNQAGAVILIAPQQSASGTNALHTADADFFAPIGRSDTNGSASLHSADADLFEPTTRTSSPTQWVAETKPSTSWTSET